MQTGLGLESYSLACGEVLLNEQRAPEAPFAEIDVDIRSLLSQPAEIVNYAKSEALGGEVARAEDCVPVLVLVLSAG